MRNIYPFNDCLARFFTQPGSRLGSGDTNVKKAVTAFIALTVLWERCTREQLQCRIVNANSVCPVTLMERRVRIDLERGLLSRILKKEQEIGQDEERYSRPKGWWCGRH